MTLQQLQQVITIADSKSMNEAAKKLYVSQPNLSSVVKELEAEAGISIFIRSNRGIAVTPEGEEFTVRASCEGRILHAEEGSGGFGYDPLFYVEEYGKTLASVTPEEKNAISHRGKALRAFVSEYQRRRIDK